jgi:hypothetical protein
MVVQMCKPPVQKGGHVPCLCNSLNESGAVIEVVPSQVTVNNVGPTLTATGSAVDQNMDASVDGTIADPDPGDVRYVVQIFGSDGKRETFDLLFKGPGSRAQRFNHRCADKGVLQVLISLNNNAAALRLPTQQLWLSTTRKKPNHHCHRIDD